MNIMIDKELSSFLDKTINNMGRFINENDSEAYLKDPVFHIVRNRVNSEFLKTIIRTNKNKEMINKIISFIISQQNENGSWNEVHPNYSKPSSLITSIIGDSLIIGYEFLSENQLEALEKAKSYVISMEKDSFFLKSEGYTADHINVDATCGAFLANYGKKFSDKECLELAEKVALHIINSQLDDGSFPYTINKGNYAYNLDIPCIHYQGVTLYYLSKINEFIDKEWIKKSILEGCKWLASVQDKNGSFDWSKSGLMFAYYLSGAYGFAFASFNYAAQWEPKYNENARKSLEMLIKNSKGIMLRWETSEWLNLPSTIVTTFKTSLVGNYPLRHRFFRFGYGTYRQIARRRYSENLDDKAFKFLTKIFRIKNSTIDPFSNYPDMFMTSEVLDCLSYSLACGEKNDLQ